MVQKINSKEELQKAIQDNKILLVKYGASWCGPCKMLTPVLEFYKNGEMVKQETGFRPENTLREILNDIKE